jgi:ABC-type thiamine transport system substrate-binding protein
MPFENLMYSVIEGENLPEENGYRFNSVIPSNPANISYSDIGKNIETWLELWNEAMIKSE